MPTVLAKFVHVFGKDDGNQKGTLMELYAIWIVKNRHVHYTISFNKE